ncbi:MAG: hypothetical protein Q8R91_04410 [Candidatus Omnitrophota bacterium]|nr:hypothetical protein [Candidatus Omnitrophota bacterium]
MNAADEHGLAFGERRGQRRIQLSAPMEFGKGSGGKGELIYFSSGHSLDVSTSGVRMVTNEPGPFTPGEILAVSIEIPWETRRVFPFSRIVGFGRVLRVEEEPRPEEGGQRHVALEFLSHDTTLLGAIVTS